MSIMERLSCNFQSVSEKLQVRQKKLKDAPTLIKFSTLLSAVGRRWVVEPAGRLLLNGVDLLLRDQLIGPAASNWARVQALLLIVVLVFIAAEQETNQVSFKVDWLRLVTPKKVNKCRLNRRCAMMTSQLRHFFQASQAVHGTDDVTSPYFLSQVYWSLWSQVDTLICYRELECPTILN